MTYLLIFFYFNRQSLHENEQQYYQFEDIQLNLIKSIISRMINRVKDLKIAIKLQRYLAGNTSIMVPNLHRNIMNSNLAIIQSFLNKPQVFYFSDQKRPPWNQQDRIGQNDKQFSSVNKKYYTLLQLNKTINEKKLSQSKIKEMISQIQQIIGSLISYVENIKNKTINDKEKYIIMKLVYFLKSRNKIFSDQYQKLMKNVVKLINNQKLLNLLLQNFESLKIKQKHFVVNFLLIFHKNNKNQMHQLKTKIQASQIKDFSERYLAHDIILYLKQIYILRRLLKNQPIELRSQFINQCHGHIIKYIGTLQPNFVANYIRYRDPRIKLEGKYFLQYVQKHLKKMKQVQDRNSLDKITHLMRILVQIPIQNPEDLSPQMTQIRQMANSLIQVFNENYKQITEKNEDVQDKEAKVKPYIVRISEINLLFQSLIKLSVIDYTFFTLLENMFLNGVYVARYDEIERFIHHKVSFIKLVRGTMSQNSQQLKQQVIQQNGQNQQISQKGLVSSNLRKLKQDHKIFVQKLFHEIQRNSNLTLRQIFKLINLCQRVPFKSRKLKKAFQELLQQNKKKRYMTEQEIALIQSMISLI